MGRGGEKTALAHALLQVLTETRNQIQQIPEPAGGPSKDPILTTSTKYPTINSRPGWFLICSTCHGRGTDWERLGDFLKEVRL